MQEDSCVASRHLFDARRLSSKLQTSGLPFALGAANEAKAVRNRIAHEGQVIKKGLQ